MDGMRRLLSYARRAADDYGMIEPHDRIAVGLSGGKDSIALLLTLNELRRFYPTPFTLEALTVDMGRPGVDFSALTALCASIGVPYTVIPSEIAHVVFDVRQESNPCSLCAKLRRGMLHTAAVERGCNKVALGHHFDDAVETFFLNLFHEGRIGSFRPVTYLDRTGVTVIRPLLYCPEKDISYFARKNALPVLDSLCPVNHKTERESVKIMLREMERKDKGLKHRVFGAMQRAGIDGYGKRTDKEEN